MRERSVWRWWGPVLLLAAGLILVATLPTAALASFFEHPEHPVGRAADGTPHSQVGARWLRLTAVMAAVAWVAGALLLLRWRSDGDRASHEPVRAREFVIVASITAIGLAVRLPFLHQSLWFDEIAAIGDFTKHGPGPILGAWFTPSNHVLQSLLTWCSASLFGAGEMALRAPSWIAGILAIVAVHALGRRTGGPTLGFAAAAVMAIMPVAVLASTEARGYGLVMLFVAMALWAFARGLRSGEPWTSVVIGLAGALAIWSHFVAVLAIAGIAGVALVRLLTHREEPHRRARAGAALVGVAMAGVLALAFLAPLLPDVLAGRRQFAASAGETPKLISPEGWRLLLMLGGTWSVALPPLAAAAPGLLLALVGAWSARRNPIAASVLAASGLAWLLLIALAAGGSWTYARFAAFVIPGAALAVGLGVLTVMGRQRQIGIGCAAMFIASCALELSLLPPRQPIRDAWEAVALTPARRADDLGIDLGIRGNVGAFYAPPGMMVLSGGIGGEMLERRLRDPRVRWAVVTYPEAQSPERWNTLEVHGFQHVRSWPGWIDWGRGSVQLWSRAARDPIMPRP